MSKWRRNKSLPRRWQKDHLIKKYGGNCFYCGLPFNSMKDITIDHFIPISKGGIDEIENFRLAHSECNQIKKDMSYEEFLIFQKGGLLVE